MRITAFLSIVLVALPALGQSPAEEAFTQLKTLAGNWTGQATVPSMPGQDSPVRRTLRVTSGGAAVFHEMVPTFKKDDPANGEYDPITIFYIDADRLLLTHYCDSAKNRPRMAGKLSADGKSIVFHFLDVSGDAKHGS